jgi:uncharacterized repeat protein (TIGR01451 family)/LPXTG-motif cell wall-anchored protein
VIVIGDPFITKSVNPPFTQPGEIVVWTITVTNPGSINATNIILVDNMPAVVEIQSVTATNGSITFNGQQVTYTQAVLSPGETVTLTITTRVRDDAVLPFTLTNSATITNSENPTPRSAQATLTGVSNLPNTGETLPPVLWLGLIIGILGAAAFIGRSVWKQSKR